MEEEEEMVDTLIIIQDKDQELNLIFWINVVVFFNLNFLVQFVLLQTISSFLLWHFSLT